MSVEALKVRVGADISDLLEGMKNGNKSLQNFQDQLARFKQALASSTDPKSILRLNAAIDAAQTKIKAITSAGSKSPFEPLKQGTDRAGNALMNFGRIAQDAPFGIIGISNNINPLLESLQRLQAESKATGTSLLKNLGQSLMGGAGIGLAISVATGLLTVLAQNGFFKSAKAADELAERTKRLKEIQDSANESLSKELVQLQVFLKVATNTSNSYASRKEAVDQLQKLYPGYLGNLKDEAILNGKVSTEIDRLTNSLYNKAYAEAASSKAQDGLAKVLDLEKQRNDLVNQRTEAFRKVSNQDIKMFGNDVISFPIISKQISEFDAKIAEARKGVGFFIDEAAKFQSKSTGLFKPDKVKVDKTAENDAKRLIAIQKELNDGIALNAQLRSRGLIDIQEEDIDKISKTKAAIESILKLKTGPELGSSIIQKLILSINPEEAKIQLAEKIKESVKGLTTERPSTQILPEVKIPIDLKPTINTDRVLSEITRKLKEDFTKLGLDIQKTVLDSGIGSIGETIGAAIGGGDVGGAFKGLLDTIISGMKQLGQAMIALGTAKIALEKFNLAPGIGTVIAGVGIIALSSLIQSALPKFAGGVTGFGGGVALVGERGPEMVRLPQGSDVIPNHRLNSIAGGGQQVFIPEISLRGTDLLIAFTRAQNQQNRRG
jgi:hypothetical protein